MLFPYASFAVLGSLDSLALQPSGLAFLLGLAVLKRSVWIFPASGGRAAHAEKAALRPAHLEARIRQNAAGNVRVESPVPAIVGALGMVGARFSCVVVTHCGNAEIATARKDALKEKEGSKGWTNINNMSEGAQVESSDATAGWLVKSEASQHCLDLSDVYPDLVRLFSRMESKVSAPSTALVTGQQQQPKDERLGFLAIRQTQCELDSAGRGFRLQHTAEVA